MSLLTEHKVQDLNKLVDKLAIRIQNNQALNNNLEKPIIIIQAT